MQRLHEYQFRVTLVINNMLKFEVTIEVKNSSRLVDVLRKIIREVEDGYQLSLVTGFELHGYEEYDNDDDDEEEDS